MDLPLADALAPAGVVGVLLTGGTGARLGGADKAALVAGGRRLLDRSLAALAVTDAVVVVGPPVEVPDAVGAVQFVREEPARGGPAAGLLAGLDAALTAAPTAAGPVPPAWVAVLAVDMPWVTAATVARLLAAAREGASGEASDGAVLVDADGRRQLCAVLRVAPLLAVRPPDPAGLGFFRLLGGLDLDDVRAVGREAVDVDTPDDLAALATDRHTDEADPVNELDAWLTDLTATLGPDAAFGADSGDELDTKALLDLTRVVAHDVVRPAAPLTLFVLGLVAGRTGAGPAELASLTAQVEALVAARAGRAAEEGDH